MKLKSDAEKMNKEMREKHKRLKNEACDLKYRVCDLESKVERKDSIIYESDLESNQNLKEIETLQLQIVKLREELQAKHSENMHHIKMRIKLEKECERLRSNVVYTSNIGCSRNKPLPSVTLEKEACNKIRKQSNLLSSPSNRLGITSNANCDNTKRNTATFYGKMMPSYTKQEKPFFDLNVSHKPELSLAEVALESCIIDQ